MSFSGIKMRLVYYAQELSSVFDIGVQREVDSTETPCCSETIDSIWNRVGFAETLEDKLQLYLLSSAVNQFGVKIISNSNYAYTMVWETSGNHAHSFLSQAVNSPARKQGLLNHEETAWLSSQIKGLGTLRTWLKRLWKASTNKAFSLLLRKQGLGFQDINHSLADTRKSFSSLRKVMIYRNRDGIQERGRGAFQWQTSLTSFWWAGFRENASIKCAGLLPMQQESSCIMKEYPRQLKRSFSGHCGL